MFVSVDGRLLRLERYGDYERMRMKGLIYFEAALDMIST